MSLWSPIPCYFSHGFVLLLLLFFYFSKNKTSLLQYSNFIGAKHKATETFAKYYRSNN